MKKSKKHTLYIGAAITVVAKLIFTANFAYKAHVVYYSCQSKFLRNFVPGVSLKKTLKYLHKSGVRYEMMSGAKYKEIKYKYVAPKLSEGANTRLIIYHFTDKFILIPDGCQYIMDFNKRGVMIKKYKS